MKQRAVSYFQRVNSLIGIALPLIFLLGLALPFKDQWSTVLMLLLLLISILICSRFRIDLYTQVLKLFWIPLVLFLPRILGLFTGEMDFALKELLRSLPVLIIPFAFLVIRSRRSEVDMEKHFTYGLVIGILIAMLICELRVIASIISNDQPLSYLFRWRYMNINFSKPIEVHPPYLGMLIVFAVVQILFSDFFHKKWHPLLIGLFIVLLFQLVARNALFVTLFIVIIYAFHKKIKWLQISIVSALVIFISILVFHPSDYLRNKYLLPFTHEEALTKDNRFSRLEASVQVFKQSPIWGVGPGYDNELRKKAYMELKDEVAYGKVYNSHNQFMEFLTANGIVGLLCFIVVLIALFRLLTGKKKLKYVLLLSAFCIACITESVLERSLGIKYFSILIGIIFIAIIQDLNFESSGIESEEH